MIEDSEPVVADDEPTPTPLDDAIVRNTAEEVKATARRAHRVEIALVVLASVLMVGVAGFTGWNTYRLRTVNQNLTELVETLNANQEALQRYNEAHAGSTAGSHAALARNLACMSDFFFALSSGAPADKATLDACFMPTNPAPPAEPSLNGSKGKR